MTFQGREISAPARLEHVGFLLRPIVAADAELDYAAVMETREFLRRWERSSWPEDDFTVEANRKDMVKMETRHRSGESFGYTVMNPAETECLGCVYVFSTTARWYEATQAESVGSASWSDCDAMVHYWVRGSQMEQGFDQNLLAALIPWFRQDWGFEAPVFITNESLDEQVAALEASAVQRQFKITHPDSTLADLGYL